MPDRDDRDARIEALEQELAAARRTVDALALRVEAWDNAIPEETGALAQALAGVQRELVRRTRSLEEAEATYRALYESTPDPLLTVDASGLVVACNRTALDWFGVERDHVIGAPLSRFLAPEEVSDLEGLIAQGWRGVAERRFTLRDGHRVSFNAARIAGARDGGFHVTVRDVTTREALEGAEDERRRMQALSELAGGLARELNDPMSIVQGRLELLLELGGSRPETLERHLQIALTHARRISATLQNLRLVGRTAVTHLERVYLVDAWEAARELVGPRLEDLDLRISVDPDDLAAGGSEPLYARGLANLVDRIIDVCGRNGRLDVSARSEDGQVVVRLLGGGRMPATAQLVPPPEVDEARLDDGGLGVALAKTIVRSMGGRLVARSTGRRAMYELRLPEAPPVRAHPRPMKGRVLVVGDADFRRGVEELIRGEGLEVVGLSDAEQALERLAEHEAEGVVSGLLLPGTSGHALLREVARGWPGLRDRLVLVAEAPVTATPHVHVLRPPLRSGDLLRALGRKVRAAR